MNRVAVGLGSCGLAAGGQVVYDAIIAGLDQLGVEAQVQTTGCLGLCYREVLVQLTSDELGDRLYGDVTADDVAGLLTSHFVDGVVVPASMIDLDDDSADARFLAAQTRVVLRHCGVVDPSSARDYIRLGGYEALRRVLADADPAAVIETIAEAGLRGRGGAGFPTATKWRLARGSSNATRYLICNADEGDPGAFMDRNIIEGDPFAVVEGMTIAAFAIGAREAIVYVRDEYPLAVQRISHAVASARACGYLGEDILGSGFDLEISVKRGAGAFVCGEETALIAALEGRRGTPRLRPPYPVQSGLWGAPTVINNVETFANVPWILGVGAGRFAELGADNSRGTKVFSLAGDVARTGMVEVPMGVLLDTIVDDIGGGSSTGRPIKAVQIGGPAGGCLPATMFGEIRLDYESLADTGAIMGSGGLVVMDEYTCMVEVARYFMAFCADESCGKCTFCRIGTRRMLDILERLCLGKGRKTDLAALEVLAAQVQGNSLCGLGKSAPNPVSTSLRYFRPEFEAHLEGRCPAGQCRALIAFHIDAAVCEGCSLCLDQCAMVAINQHPRLIPLEIDLDVCVSCGGCFQTCPYDAITIQ